MLQSNTTEHRVHVNYFQLALQNSASVLYVYSKNSTKIELISKSNGTKYFAVLSRKLSMPSSTTIRQERRHFNHQLVRELSLQMRVSMTLTDPLLRVNPV